MFVWYLVVFALQILLLIFIFIFISSDLYLCLSFCSFLTTISFLLSCYWTMDYINVNIRFVVRYLMIFWRLSSFCLTLYSKFNYLILSSSIKFLQKRKTYDKSIWVFVNLEMYNKITNELNVGYFANCCCVNSLWNMLQYV